MSFRRLLAIDPSLTCTGWALFAVHSGGLLGVGKIKSLPPKIPLSDRYANLQIRISDLFDKVELCANDVLVCEAPTTMKDPKAAFKVEGVRGIFETLARQRNVSVPGRINPRTIQNEAMGLRGPQVARAAVKSVAVKTVSNLYRADLESIGFTVDEKEMSRHQDIVDAILVGRIGIIHIQAASNSGMTLEQAFVERRVATRR